MKFTKEHYALLRVAIGRLRELSPSVTAKTYVDSGLSPERFRWDSFWAATALTSGSVDGPELRRIISKNYSDNHIDTALRRIWKEQ